MSRGSALSGFTACVEMLFVPETADFAERVQMAADAGFSAIEFWNASKKDMAAFNAAVAAAGIDVAGFLVEPYVDLTDPSTHEKWLKGLSASLDTAIALEASMLILGVGNEREGVPRAEQRKALVEALVAAADTVTGTGVYLVVEPITRQERPHYFLPWTPEALDIIDDVGRDEVKLLYDMFHSADMGEDMKEVLAGRVDRVLHVHLSDIPGRHEPGTGTMNWRENIAWLRSQGYAGRVGLEYRPTGGTIESLKFLD